MKRYHASVIVRSDEQDHDAMQRAEWLVKCNITAPDPTFARRMVLERAYAGHLLVSRFVHIKTREIS